MAESSESSLTARAVAQKAYKKNKKKRAKAKQAAEKQQAESSTTKQQQEKKTSSWHRIQQGPDCPKAINRPVDDAKITALLEKRSKAKAEKKYDVSDAITDKLIDMEIVYDDNKKQWHTRLLSTVAQKAKKKRAGENKTGEPAAKKTKQ